MGYQNFFATRLFTDIGASDTTITLENAPTPTEGRLVLEARNSTKREIISYTGVSGNDITGVTRGVGGTTATTHTQNSLVEMNVTAEDLEDALNVPDDIITRFNETISDHVASGLLWTDDIGLTADMLAGVAYINGIRLPVDAVSNRAFTASRDTYVDLGDNGVLDYNEVSNGAAAPALAASHIRLARVVTNGTDTTSVTNYVVSASLTKADGWSPTGDTHSVTTGYNSGNRSFLINTSTDLTGIVSPGMRYRVTRNTTPPTQCADLEEGSSQYASKTSPTGTNLTTTVTAEAWVKLESYGASNICVVVSRFTGGNGWSLRIQGGAVYFFGGTSSVYDIVTSYQALPLNKWVHIAASLTINSAGAIYIDGVSVPVSYTNSAATAIASAGNLEVGTQTGALFMDGKLSDVRVWSDIRTATEIQDNMYAYPSDTTGLVAHFKLNGDFTDASSNANNLTASGGAVATDADNPWNATEQGIITNVTASTLQVFCPSGYGIPNETLTAPFYSTQSAPFGFPRDRGLWTIETLNMVQARNSTPTINVWYNLTATNVFNGFYLTVPIGAWEASYNVSIQANGSATTLTYHGTLSTANNTETDRYWTSHGETASAASSSAVQVYRSGSIVLTTPTAYYFNTSFGSTVGATNIYNRGELSTSIIRATCAYL